MYMQGSDLNFTTGGTNRLSITTQGHLVPFADNTYDLGATGARFRDAWVQRGAFNGSDERLKNQIRPTRFGMDFIRKLRPVSWQWKDTSGHDTALHHGFIAQEVKRVLTDLGASNHDFGGYHDPADRHETGHLALNYNEFISPLVAAFQELDRRSISIPKPGTPINSTAPGNPGEQYYNDEFLFTCVAPNQWKRVRWISEEWS